MKMAVVGLGILMLGSCPCMAGKEPSRSLIELSVGPVITESAPIGAQAVAGVAAQYTWLRSPERRSTFLVALRYRHGPFEAPSRYYPAAPPPLDWTRGSARGDAEPRRAHFVEMAAGTRSSSPRGVWFGEFEAGLAAIRYDRADDEPIRERASPFAGLRLGAVWPSESCLSATMTVAVRVYPGVESMFADASLGVAWAP